LQVFNVWRGRTHYGKDGPYGIFAGRDATRLLAKNILELESEAEACEPLTAMQEDAVADWVSFFMGKYDCGT